MENDTVKLMHIKYSHQALMDFVFEILTALETASNLRQYVMKNSPEQTLKSLLFCFEQNYISIQRQY